LSGDEARYHVKWNGIAAARLDWQQKKAKPDRGGGNECEQVAYGVMFLVHKRLFFHLSFVMGTAFVCVSTGYLQAGASSTGLVRATSVSSQLVEDIRYGTTKNFTGKDLYGGLKECWLLPEAAKKLAVAQKSLSNIDPALRLVVYDCARPESVQRVMWEVVKDTPQRTYVADPAKGSVHNYGCAVDLGIIRASGKGSEYLDMGTPFDHFGPEAHTTDEAQMLLDGSLSRKAWLNRMLLRRVMVEAGFFQLPHEWWHYDCMKLDELKARYLPVKDIRSLR
jgi:D-alanyl-D-alanine dipeptidase